MMNPDILNKSVRLTAGVKMRREKFGGILYQHSTGKITFIYNQLVVNLLEQQEDKTIALFLNKMIDNGITDKKLFVEAIKILHWLKEGGFVYES